MDERARAIFEQAFSTIERADAERADVMAEIDQREANELVNGFSNNPMKQRETRGLVYKTTEQPEPTVKTMDQATAASWNSWADARIRAAIQTGLLEFADLVGAETGLMETRFNAELKRLSAEIEALREDVRAALAKNVTPLRPRDVA